MGRARVNYSWLLTMEDERRRERGEARSQMVTNGVLIMPGCFFIVFSVLVLFLFTIFPLSFSLCTHCVCVVNNSNDESSHTHTHTHSVVERKAKKSYLKFCHKTFPGFSLSLLLLFFLSHYSLLPSFCADLPFVLVSSPHTIPLRHSLLFSFPV